MQYLRLKDKTRRLKFQQKEFYRLVWLGISFNEYFTKLFRIWVYLNIIKKKFILNKNSVVSVKNRCLLTNYPRSYKDFKLSRIQLRKVGSYGYLPGIKKSSW